MQLDWLDGAFFSFDTTIMYFIVCWMAAGCAVLDMQKIARCEVMTRVRAPWRHLVRFILAILGVILLWNGYAPIRYESPPRPSDMALVIVLGLLLLAHAATGYEWAREPERGR